MPNLIVDAANFVTWLFSLTCVVFIYLLYRLTRVNAFFLLMAAYGWTVMIRTGISFHLPFVSEYSAPLTLGTLAFHAGGLLALLLALRKVYAGGPSAVENVVQTAASLARAAAVAQVAREHAMAAADAAEKARLYAKEAAVLADEATLVSRHATRAAGVASQVSKDADARVSCIDVPGYAGPERRRT
jgi:hypothetical protein